MKTDNFTKNITIPATMEDHELRSKIKKYKKVSDQSIFREGLKYYATQFIDGMSQNNTA